MKQYSATLLITLTLLATSVYGQDTSKPITYTQDTKNQAIESLNFTEEGTGKVIKRFDLKAKNPYNQLTLPKKTTLKGSSPAYELSGVSKDALIARFLPHVTLTSTEKSSIQFTTTSTGHSFYIGEQYAAVCYELNVYGNEGDALTVQSTAFVLNSKGEIIFQLPENHSGCASPVVTDNGKYLALMYGSITVHASIAFTESPGIRMYDVTTGKQLVDIPTSKGYSISPPMVHRNKIIEVLRYRNRNRLYLIYDLDKHILYKKEYTYDEKSGLKRFEEFGMVFSTPTGSEKTDYFEKDFTKEPL